MLLGLGDSFRFDMTQDHRIQEAKRTLLGQASRRKARLRAIAVLTYIGSDEALEVLLEALQHTDSESLQLTLLEALSQLPGERCVRALCRLLSHDTLRRQAADALQTLGFEPTPQSAPRDGLLYFLTLEDWRACVAWGETARAPLTRALGDPAHFVTEQEGVLDALIALGGPSTRSLCLDGLMRTSHARIRERLSRALVELGALEPLLHAWPTSSGLSKIALAHAMDQLGWTPENPEETLWLDVARKDWTRVARAGAQALPVIRSLVDSGASAEQLTHILDLLEDLASPACVSPLFTIASRDAYPLELRRRARTALASIGPSGIEALGLLLGITDDASFRIETVRELAGLDHPTATDLLMRALNGDAEPSVRRAVLTAVGRHYAQTPRFLILSRGLAELTLEERLEAINQLERHAGQRGMGPLLERCAIAQHPDELAALLHALSRLPQAPLELFTARVPHPHRHVRLAAVAALCERPGHRSAWMLVGSLADPCPRVAGQARRGLVAAGDAALPALVDALTNDRGSTAETLHAIFAEVGPPAALFLAGQLEEHDARGRIAILEILDAIGDATLLEPVLRVRKDTNRQVRAVALRVLEGMGWQPDAPEEQALLLATRHDWEALRALGEAAVGALTAALQPAHPIEHRTAAARTLGAIGGDEAVLALQHKASEEDVQLRVAVVKALGRARSPKALETLVEALSDVHKTVRREAAAALGKLADPRAVAPLMASLEHGTSERAIWALAEIGEPALEPLVHALENAAHQRGWMARALGELGDTRAVPPLLRVLDSPMATQARASAAEALALIGDAARTEPVLLTLLRRPEHEPELQCALVRALGQLAQSEQAIAPLIRRVSASLPEVRAASLEALRALQHRGLPAHDALVEAIQSNALNAWQLASTVRALSNLDEPSGIPVLLEQRHSPHHDVRIAALEGLARRGGGEHLQTLIESLDDPVQAVGAIAAEALGNLREPWALEPLIQALQTSGAEVRAAAASALGKIADLEAVLPLVHALSDSTYAVMHASATALSAMLHHLEPEKTRVLQQDPESLVEALLVVLDHTDPAVGMATVEVLHALGVTALEFLCLLGDIDSVVQQRVSEALKRVGEPIFAPLVDALEDRDPSVRAGAAVVLASLNDARSLEPLMAAVTDPVPSVRRSAVEALGQLGDKRGAEALGASVRDEDASVRRAALSALWRLGDAAVEPLAGALRDAHPIVRREAAVALSKLADTRAVDVLLRGLESPMGAMGASAVLAGALGKLGDRRAVPSLLRALQHPEPNTRREVAAALGNLGDRRGVEPLIEALSDADREVRKDAAGALFKIGDPRALEALSKLTRDPDKRVRKTVERWFSDDTKKRRFVRATIRLYIDDPELEGLSLRALEGDAQAISQLMRVARRHNNTMIISAFSLLRRR